MELNDFIQCDDNGKGIINIMDMRTAAAVVISGSTVEARNIYGQERESRTE